MADAVRTQVIVDGQKYYKAIYHNVSDGTGEADVVKIDVSGLATSSNGDSCTGIRVTMIWALTSGMTVTIEWDQTTVALLLKIPDGDNTGPISFEHSDGFINPGASGSTGDIMFTTTGHASGDTYTVLLEGYKTY